MQQPPPRASGKRVRPVWIALLIVALCTLGAQRYMRWRVTEQQANAAQPTDSATAGGSVDQTAYARFKTAAMAAERIDDPLQRCLAYPDPSGSRWDRSVTAAYCRYRNLPIISRAQIEHLLDTHRADELDRVFAGYLDDEVSGRAPDHLTLAADTLGFREASKRARALLDRWKSESPHSAIALAMSGAQSVAAAWDARGADTAGNTSDAQFEAMETELVHAQTDLEQASLLEARIGLIYQSMVNMSGLIGDRLYRLRAVDAGMRATPYNMGFRSALIRMSQPKWGGSWEELKRQMEAARTDAARNPLLGLVARTLLADYYGCFCESPTTTDLHRAIEPGALLSGLQKVADRAFSLDPLLAIELYSETLRFDPVRADAARYRTRLLLAHDDAAWALASGELATRQHPDDPEGWEALGEAYRTTGRLNEADRAFSRAIELDPDHHDALRQLGDMDAHEGHKPEAALAIANHLIALLPDDQPGYAIRASVVMHSKRTARAVRDQVARDYIARFNGRPEEQANLAKAKSALASGEPMTPYID